MTDIHWQLNGLKYFHMQLPILYYREQWDLTAPPAFVAPMGVTPVEFRGDLWHQKTRVPELSCDPVFSRFSRTPSCDRQTQGHSIYRACIALRGINWHPIVALCVTEYYKLR